LEGIKREKERKSLAEKLEKEKAKELKLALIQTKKELKKEVPEKKKEEKVKPVKKIPKKLGIEKEKKKITISIVPIINKAIRLDKEAKIQVSSIQKEVSKYIKAGITKIKKGKPEKEAKGISERKKDVKKPVKKAIPTVGYKEAFKPGEFLRKNAFKLVFLILLIGWFIELFLLVSRLKSHEERLKMIVFSQIERLF